MCLLIDTISYAGPMQFIELMADFEQVLYNGH